MADLSLKSSDSATPVEPVVEFVCNICGRANRTPRSRFGREIGSCVECQSTVRTRAVIRMMSREMLGLELALPDFPVLKDIRGIGISDSPDYAGRLAEKFSYRNTYYHKEPRFDILNIPESEWGTYDFVIASEVFEHVAPPVNVPFEHAYRLLKPTGLFFFTVPYTHGEKTTEHFPELDDYRVVELAGQWVMLNRTRDGRLQIFEELVFHGGGGETLELRVFTENDLRRLLLDAGFRSVEVYGGNHAGFGILHAETWSLPMAARKDPFALSGGALRELIAGWRASDEKLKQAGVKLADDEKELAARTEWAAGLDAELKNRTEWARSLEQDVAHHVEIAKKLQAEFEERTAWALKLQAENKELTARLQRLHASPWTKAGRALGLLKE